EVSRQLMDGYASAMALPGHAHELAAFVLAALTFAALLVAIARARGRRGALELAPCAVFLPALYKSGFLRQDIHALTSESALLRLALLAFPGGRARIGARVALVLGGGAIALGVVDVELVLLHYQRRGVALSALQALPRSGAA